MNGYKKMGAPALVEGQSKILKIRLIYILMLKHSALLPDSEPRGARLLTPRRRIENSSLANSNEKAKKTVRREGGLPSEMVLPPW